MSITVEWLTRYVLFYLKRGHLLFTSHTSEFRPWLKNCRMSWPPIQLVQTDAQTRKGWQPLRTAQFTPSPRSWLDSWIALMAADCPSPPGVWNLSPLAPSYLLASSWPQNRWKATDLYLGRSPIYRQSMWSHIPGSWCSYPSIPVQQESGSPSQGLKHNPYLYRTRPLPAATETAIRQTGNPATTCALKRMSR